MLHGTTKKFLEVFGLNSLKDLPKVEELKNPSQ
jgi:chromosome segregation and condensation protein ScpB